MTEDRTDTARALKGARILILFPHMVTTGGALNYTLRLAGELVKEGAKVAILVLRARDGVCDVPSGVEVLTLDGPLTSSLRYWLFFPLWQWRIHRVIAAWRPDVLVSQVFPANWWGWLYKRRCPGMKLVWVCHEPSAFIHSLTWIRALRPRWKSFLAWGLSPFLAKVDISLARYSDRIIANSRFTAAELERVYGVPADGIAYPGIDFAAHAGEGWNKESAVLTVARLTKFKRIDFLLQIFKELLLVYPDLTYHIVGTGEDEASLRGRARRLGVEGRVRFHGAADGRTLARLYGQSTLFLHGTVGEPFGMAPLEAIASGTPVVAHASGGPTEFVSETCGRLIPSLRVEDWTHEIAEYLEFLLANPDFPNQVRECARSFDWRVSLRPAVEVIAELCAADE